MSPLEAAGIVTGFLLGALIFAWAVRGAARAGGRGGSEYLCDRCKYDDARYCSRPERPNAITCADFKAR